MSLLITKRKEAAAAKVESEETMLSKARRGSPRGEYTTMPDIGRVWVELAGGEVVEEIEGSVFEIMAAKKLAPIPINASTYDACRLALTLAWCVRHPDPDKRELRVGSEDEWRSQDIDYLQACGIVYADVRERRNPLSQPLSQEQLDDIRLGIEKKNPMLLQSVGVVALSSYLLTTVAPPASSPIPQSSTGESQ